MEKITDHPFVPGDPNYGWERECGFHVTAPSQLDGTPEDCCCGAAQDDHSESLPRGVYEAGLQAAINLEWWSNDANRLRHTARLLHSDTWPRPDEYVGTALLELALIGSSVSLNHGEDTGQWECLWVAHGVRYTGCGEKPWEAVRGAIMRVLGQLPTEEAPIPSDEPSEDES